jgi:hypothetical protein
MKDVRQKGAPPDAGVRTSAKSNNTLGRRREARRRAVQ